MRAVMVGGPLHGQTRDFPDGELLPRQINVPRPVSTPFVEAELSNPIGPYYEPPYRYEMRGWYNGWLSWPPTGPTTRTPAYLCTEKPDLTRPVPDDEQAHYFRHVADDMWHMAEEQALPSCVVPDCQEKGRLTFTAAERGRLAGREWQRGDEIRVCPRHGHDIHMAQGARGMDQLAEWLRPDATWDPLDIFASGMDQLAETLERTARILRLETPSR